MTFELTSTAFTNGDSIPMRYTCDGDNISPALMWTDPPAGTKSFAIVHDDPDDTPTTWVHWVLFNIPAEARGLQENRPKDERLPDGSLQGLSDFKKVGYGGPCPPTDTHHYLFKLYALDGKLDLAPRATYAQLEAAMKGHILAEARLMGTYRLIKNSST